MADQYEFGARENQVIGELSSRMRFVAVFILLLSALSIVSGFLTLAGGSGYVPIVNGVVALIGALWQLKAARSFREIVDTSGNDLDHLMEALVQLRRFYTLQVLLVVVLITVVTLMTVFALYQSVST